MAAQAAKQAAYYLQCPYEVFLFPTAVALQLVVCRHLKPCRLLRNYTSPLFNCLTRDMTKHPRIHETSKRLRLLKVTCSLIGKAIRMKSFHASTQNPISCTTGQLFVSLHPRILVQYTPTCKYIILIVAIFKAVAGRILYWLAHPVSYLRDILHIICT